MMHTIPQYFRTQTLGKNFFYLAFFVTIISIATAATAMGIITLYYKFSQNTTFHSRERQIQFAINNLQALTHTFTHDYATWDDMAEGVQRRDSAWMSTAFADSFSTYNLDGLWIYDTAGELLFTQKSDRLPQSVQTLDHFHNTQTALASNQAVEYYTYVDHVLTFYVTEQIQYHTQENGTTYGVLTVAKNWGTAEKESLTNILQATVDIGYQAKAGPSINLFQNAGHQYQLIGPQGQRATYFQVHFYDNSLFFLWRTLIVVQLLIISAGLLLIAVSHRIQYLLVIEPLKRISKKIELHFSRHEDFLHPKNEMQLLETIVTQFIDQHDMLSNQKKNLDTIRKKLQQQLDYSSRFFQAVESSAEPIIMTDTHGTIVYINPAWSQQNGYTTSEALGENPRILQSHTSPRSVYTMMWKQLAQGLPFVTDQLINKRKNGTLWHCRLSLYPIRKDGKNLYYVGIQQDITQQKQLDQMKTEFISMASHQLRTPLSAIRWFTELLQNKEHGHFSKKEQELISNIYQSTLRMITLVENLLNISRLESGRIVIEPKDIHLRDLIGSVKKELHHIAEKKHLTLDCRCPNIVMRLDEGMMREVLNNLITNAMKYSPEHTKITITVDQIGEKVRFSISDQGIGIDQSEQSQVFHKFFRGTNALKFESDGTGLGLYLVYKIVEAFGGKVWFTSIIGEGTTFFIELPRKGMSKKEGSVKLRS